MLTTLRDHAQSWIIKVILGIIVITFVISFGIGTFSRTKEVLVRIGRDEILVRDFNKIYQEELDRLRRQFPDKAEKMAQEVGLRRKVFDRMIDRRLVLDAARGQGFVVSDEEVQESIMGEKVFHVNDRFDFATYRTILQQNNLTPEIFEGRVREDLLLQKYQRSLLAGVTVSQAEVEQRFRMENERVVVDYVYLDPAHYEGGVQVSDEELKAYHDAHQNEFMQPAQYQVRYLVLRLDDLSGDADLADKAVQRYYERHKEEFSTPKRIRASHILKRIDPEAPPQAKAAARKEMTEILAKAQAGADFAQLARTYSEDLTKSKGGDLGFFKKGEMVPDFEDAAFALEPGQISGIVESPFGLHIIKVTEVQPGSEKPLAQVEAEIRSRLTEERAEHKLDLEADRLPQRIQEQGLEAVAKELKRPVAETAWFDAATTLDGLGSADGLYSRVRTQQTGDAGVWRRNPVQGHVFYQVAGRREAFVQPLESVRVAVRSKVIAQKSREAAATAAKAALTQLSAPSDLARLAERERFALRSVELSATAPTIPEIGANADFQRAAFRLTEASPYGLSSNEGRTYLMRLKRRHLPENVNADQVKQQLHAQLQAEWEQYFLKKEYDRLKARVKIEVVASEYLSS